MPQPHQQPWPPAAEFQVMLQKPQLAFDNAELKSCTIELDINRQPLARAGAFATVYKGTSPSGRSQAIRVFSSRSDDRRERYEEIAKYLAGQKLDCLVNFSYLEKGIRHTSGRWYPLVTMEWVSGDVLFDWVRLQGERQNKNSLNSISEQWVDVVNELSKAGIAHGDLQHANIMVDSTGQLKLVDYDCMCVPSLEGRVNLELGVEPYQHPERNSDTRLYAGLDHFSALFIHVALRALAAEPALWGRFIESQKYDKLLFRKSDFDNPGQSEVYRELKRSPDQKVRKLVDDLFGLVKMPMKDVPPLSRFINDFEAVRLLLQQRNWDDAIELLNRNSTAIPPADMQESIQEAHDRVQCRLDLERAVQSGNEEEIQRLYVARLLDDYPKAQPLIRISKQAPQAIAALQQLKSAQQAAPRQTGGWQQFVELWDVHQSVLAGRKSAAAFESQVKQWREKNRLCTVVLALLARQPVDVRSLSGTWSSLDALGGHPDTEGRRSEVDNLLVRHDALAEFRTADGNPGESSDLAMVQAWNEALFTGWNEAERERPRWQEARDRLEQIDELRNLIDGMPTAPSVTGEKQIQEAANQLPSGYELSADLNERVDLARKRMQAFIRLKQAMSRPELVEKDLAECWQAIVNLHAESAVSALIRTRVELAVRRVPLLKKLAAISLSLPLDQLDREVLAVWDNNLLKDSADADPWKQAYQDARQRMTLITRLEEAIAADSDEAIAEAVDDPLLAKYPFPHDMASRIQRACERISEAKALLEVLQRERKSEFAQLFDQRMIRDYSSHFQQFEKQIITWIQTDILPLKKNGLAPPLVGRGMMSEGAGNGRFRLQWRWPASRFTDNCLITICRGVPKAESTGPNEIAIHRIPIDRRRWENGGYVSLTPKPEWRGKYVAIWAVIDVGFAQLYSEPLVLGRID